MVTFKEWQFETDYKVSRCRKGKQQIEYINIASGFDTETTSTYLQNGDKIGYVYEWTFGINTQICYGRYLSDFVDFLKKIADFYKLNESRRLIVYVHNLMFDFQFIRKYFDWQEVFSVDNRRCIIAITTGGIEFRDNYILSGLSLNLTANQLVHHNVKKLVGDLDYKLVHNPSTPLTEKELGYCENDVKVILAYISEQIEQYGNITKIPLTNTGRVRRETRKECFKNYNSFHKYISTLTMTRDSYDLAKRTFQGGFVHASLLYSMELCENVYSIDFTSSYPTVLLSEKFPTSRPIEVKNVSRETLDNYLKSDTLFVCTVTFTNLASKISYESYISKSKSETDGEVIVNNGRVFFADKLTISVTNVDLKIINRVYNYDSIEVSEFYKFYSWYMPKPILTKTLEFYENKTKLKGVTSDEIEGAEQLYLLSKGMLNSLYGMEVTDICRDEIDYNNKDGWFVGKGDYNAQIEKYNDSKGRFTYYWQGIFVTAYARYNLWCGILEMKDDYIYSDTDSIKFFNYEKHKPFIDNYNRMITDKVKNALHHSGIDYKIPKTKKGIEKPIGVWDIENELDKKGNPIPYKYFKTLGAKRYLYYDDKELHLTCSGIAKKSGVNYLLKISNGDIKKCFDNFNTNLTVPETDTGKNTHTYIDDERSGYITDYLGNTEHIISKSGVHLEEQPYTLDIAQQYLNFLHTIKDGYIELFTKYGKEVNL